jgi:hypothetical protein
MSHRFKEILAWCASLLIRTRTAAPAPARVPAGLAQLLGAEDRPGC